MDIHSLMDIKTLEHTYKKVCVCVCACMMSCILLLFCVCVLQKSVCASVCACIMWCVYASCVVVCVRVCVCVWASVCTCVHVCFLQKGVCWSIYHELWCVHVRVCVCVCACVSDEQIISAWLSAHLWHLCTVVVNVVNNCKALWTLVRKVLNKCSYHYVMRTSSNAYIVSSVQVISPTQPRVHCTQWTANQHLSPINSTDFVRAHTKIHPITSQSLICCPRDVAFRAGREWRKRIKLSNELWQINYYPERIMNVVNHVVWWAQNGSTHSRFTWLSNIDFCNKQDEKSSAQLLFG